MNTSNLLAENPAQNQEPVNLEAQENLAEQPGTSNEDTTEAKEIPEEEAAKAEGQE